MAYDHVKTVRTASTAQVVATGQRVVVRGIHLISSGTQGTIELRGGGSGGGADHVIDTPAVAEGDTVTIPGRGLEPLDGLHVTLTDVDAVTVFYNE